LFWLFFSLIGRFFPGHNRSQLWEQFSGSQAAFETTFRVTGGYIPESWNESLKRVWLCVTSLKKAETLFWISSQKDSQKL
jgi:hypothetical protein